MSAERELEDVYREIDKAVPLLEEVLAVMKLTRLNPDRVARGWPYDGMSETQITDAISILNNSQKNRIPF